MNQFVPNSWLLQKTFHLKDNSWKVSNSGYFHVGYLLKNDVYLERPASEALYILKERIVSY